MCGLTGFWSLGNSNSSEMMKEVGLMANAINHRGPDDLGEWADEKSGVAMGFRRLAIVDLSLDGHQPMTSKSGRYVISFNGEVYNFQELRRQLENLGIHFISNSDTEVMLGAIEVWGIDVAVSKFKGMFAFALWDKQDRTLSLVRDPFGIKPLYFGRHGNSLLWGSELKALRAKSDFHPEIDLDGLTLYFNHGYVPAPYSIYKGIKKLLPGCIIVFRSPESDGEIRRFFSVDEVALAGKANLFDGSENDAIKAVESALVDSVKLQMAAEVPLGAFLSGGVDSSLIVALMQSQIIEKVKTFCIGFSQKDYNEADHARTVAAYLGTEHSELFLNSDDVLNILPILPEVYDEPFSDPAMIPTVLLSRLTKEKVTVSLSGDGGDELFGGYHYHISAHEGLLANALVLPKSVRKIVDLGLCASGFLMGSDNTLISRIGTALQYRRRFYQFDNPVDWYRTYISEISGAGNLINNPQSPNYSLKESIPNMENIADSFMLLDIKMMLSDGYMTKLDRASMASSLEARVPFLDTDLFALACRLPTNMKVRNRTGKWILRRILSKYIPKYITDRPKHGFSVPINDLLRGPLRDWAEDLLSSKRIIKSGFFSKELIDRYWTEHKMSVNDHSQILWSILMFQVWYERWFN